MDFAQILVFECYSITTLAQESGSITEEQFYEVFFEYLYFFIHLTDRVAFALLCDPARHGLMDELGEFAVLLSVRSLFSSLSDEEKDSMFQECMGFLNTATKEYSCFQRLLAKANEVTKDTLFWEFSKKMSQMSREGLNPAAIIGRESILVTASKNLDIDSFVRKMT
jgi:hypothetical protein